MNRRNHDRARLNKILRNEFDRPAVFSPNHEIIGRLPISTMWTSNFDRLIEQALERAGRKVEIKSRDNQIAMPMKGKDVVLYKMHGDIANPDEAIICKDDYERYARKHELFQNQLVADLVGRTFLFLGFSFTDPHLDYMLGHLRSMLENSKREHFAIMRKVRKNWHASEPEAQRRFAYETNKQALQIEDLQRYSIQTHFVDSFEEVTDILVSVERGYYLQNVFVSGSAHDAGEFGLERLRDLSMELGERIVEKGFTLVSGMGLTIGESTVRGALFKLDELGIPGFDKRLVIRPFPRERPGESRQVGFNRKYRREMISKCGTAVFIAGTSRTHYESAGVLEEFEISQELGKVPVPIGATGYAARRIWSILAPKVQEIYDGAVPSQLFAQLNDSALDNSQILDTVFEIIDRVACNSRVRARPPRQAAVRIQPQQLTSNLSDEGVGDGRSP